MSTERTEQPAETQKSILSGTQRDLQLYYSGANAGQYRRLAYDNADVIARLNEQIDFDWNPSFDFISLTQEEQDAICIALAVAQSVVIEMKIKNGELQVSA